MDYLSLYVSIEGTVCLIESMGGLCRSLCEHEWTLLVFV